MSDSRRDLLTFAALAAAVALLYFPDWLPLAALGGLLFLALAWYRLDLALIFVLLSAPFYRFPRSIGPAQFTVSEMLIVACFLAWLGSHALRRLRAREWGLDLPPGWRLSRSPALFFLAAATISLFFSEYLHVSLRDYRVEIVEPLLFYGMIITTLRGEAPVWRMANAFVLLGAAMSLFALYHYFFVGVVENTGGVRRMLGIYHSPNALGLFLGRTAPVALALGIGMWMESFRRVPGSARIRGWIDGNGPAWPYLVAVPLIGASLLLSFSRGAWLGVTASLALMAGLRGRRALLATAGAAGAALAAAVPFLGLGRLVSEVTTEQRLYVWQSALRMIGERPLTGLGLDNFLYYYRERGYMLPQAWAEPDVSHPHNIVLDFWTRLGLLGVAALLWLQVSFWQRGLHLYSALAGRRLQFVVLALMGSMADFLVHGLLDNSFFLIDLAVVFWFTYGLLEVIQKEAAPVEAP